jgi:hypothetical protein
MMPPNMDTNARDKPAPAPPTERPPAAAQLTPDALREQQAIAAAMMIGENMRRGDHAQTYKLTRRLAVFVGAMAVFGLVILFALTRFAGDSFNPYPYMIGLGLVASASAAAVYWGYAASKRRGDD